MPKDILYAGTVTVPTEDQAPLAPAVPTLISLLKIVELEAGQLLSGSNRKVSISNLCVETSLQVAHTVVIIDKRNGQPAMTTPYNSLSKQIPDSDSPILSRVHSKCDNGSLCKINMCIDGSFVLQPGVTANDTVVSDILVAIVYDMSCAQIARICHEEPVCGAFTVSFSVADANTATAASAGKMSTPVSKHTLPVSAAAAVVAKSAAKKSAASSDGDFESAVSSAKKTVSQLAQGTSGALKGMQSHAKKLGAALGKRVQDLRKKHVASVKSKGAIAKKKQTQAKGQFVTI